MMTPAPAIAIILARGGSKGLPRKNALPIAGRPCIEWTIEHALAAAAVGPVVLSTDDPELLALGRAWSDRTDGRVRTHTRPAELASDTATIDAAARSAVAHYEGSGSTSQTERVGGTAHSISEHARSPHQLSPTACRLQPHSAIIILYANVPIRPPGLIDRAVRLLMDGGADSVQSYAPVGKFHPWWIARVDADSGMVRPWEGDVLNHGVFRRQDLPPAYIPDGGVIAVTREALMLEIPRVRPGPHAFFGREDRRRGVVNREGEVVDIDSNVDRMVAEAMLLAGRPHADR